jgi:hypothetical protein
VIDLSAERRLVKSPPELWAEISDPEALARHLAEFGEIRILKVVPEHTVVWKGDLASGVARIESSGWGTKVVLSAEIPEPGPEIPESPPQPQPAPPPTPDPAPSPPEPVPVEPDPTPAEPDPAAAAEAEAPGREHDEERMSLLARLFGVRWTKRPELQHLVDELEEGTVQAARQETVPEPEPETPPPPEPVAETPETPSLDPEQVQAVLDGTLDALGSAHHRPFSRA